MRVMMLSFKIPRPKRGSVRGGKGGRLFLLEHWQASVKCQLHSEGIKIAFRIPICL